jgi:hypothetical protein
MVSRSTKINLEFQNEINKVNAKINDLIKRMDKLERLNELIDRMDRLEVGHTRLINILLDFGENINKY